ncbi:TraR/DksA family transcriptional regulator [Jeongeupia chitinilytica]|uniref:TraR/DksA family transcriptional regulator n=1 Tax=Jeongeupia chitinilytica TaxID=1041641 RepID=UPI00167A58BC|nr:TraR/DksA family transcriptional regulator [Jeongeupia chitinilytica]
MTDFYDRAAALELQQREDALAIHRDRPRGLSCSHCEDCGVAIPEARRHAVPGCHRCIHCQQQAEKRKG